MIANFGYEDGSGIYYISVDTDKCAECEEHACIEACPANLFLVELDDWDDEVVVVDKKLTRQLRSCCASCKPADYDTAKLPCCVACGKDAIKHTW